ncbi:hypothetical protein V1525DRAFT_407013 [Lipomyces kononenkoae]|uniref:Uncharacterized protein n=1 Tax=Lipomyces kononenkoae TaxID=34357 RepID=A0ACC3SXQ1_LIPKO
MAVVEASSSRPCPHNASLVRPQLAVWLSYAPTFTCVLSLLRLPVQCLPLYCSPPSVVCLLYLIQPLLSALCDRISRRNMSSSTGSRSILRKFMSRTSGSVPLDVPAWHSSPPRKSPATTLLARGFDPDCQENAARMIRFYSSNLEANLDWVASNPRNEIQEEHLHRDLSLELLQQQSHNESARANGTFSWMPSVPNHRLRRAVSTLKRRNSAISSSRSNGGNGTGFFSSMYEDESDHSRIGASEDERDFEESDVEAILPAEEVTDWTDIIIGNDLER